MKIFERECTGNVLECTGKCFIIRLLWIRFYSGNALEKGLQC